MRSDACLLTRRFKELMPVEYLIYPFNNALENNSHRQDKSDMSENTLRPVNKAELQSEKRATAEDKPPNNAVAEADIAHNRHYINCYDGLLE